MMEHELEHLLHQDHHGRQLADSGVETEFTTLSRSGRIE